jgi:hypothetical protein
MKFMQRTLAVIEDKQCHYSNYLEEEIEPKYPERDKLVNDFVK